MLKFLKQWWPSAVVLGGILWLTLVPHPVGDIKVSLFPGADKIVHAVMMGTLLAALLFDWRRSGRRLGLKALLAMAAAVTLFSAIDEWAQGAMNQGRTSDPMDLLADICGVALVAATVLLAPRQLGFDAIAGKLSRRKNRNK